MAKELAVFASDRNGRHSWLILPRRRLGGQAAPGAVVPLRFLPSIFNFQISNLLTLPGEKYHSKSKMLPCIETPELI